MLSSSKRDAGGLWTNKLVPGADIWKENNTGCIHISTKWCLGTLYQQTNALVKCSRTMKKGRRSKFLRNCYRSTTSSLVKQTFVYLCKKRRNHVNSVSVIMLYRQVSQYLVSSWLKARSIPTTQVSVVRAKTSIDPRLKMKTPLVLWCGGKGLILVTMRQNYSHKGHVMNESDIVVGVKLDIRFFKIRGQVTIP